MLKQVRAHFTQPRPLAGKEFEINRKAAASD